MQSGKLFSERQKELRGEVPDMYQYDTIPRELRVQVVHIWQAAFGEYSLNPLGEIRVPPIAEVYELIHEALCYHYGKFSLDGSRGSDYDAVRNFLLETEDTERVIDVIELSFKTIDMHVRNHPRIFPGKIISPDKAIAELNYWFRQHGVGYQYESGQIVRIDAEFLHSEVVRPALIMLADPMYEGANAEFLKAHEHYREGRYKDCMTECLKAFESCIKSVCDVRGWGYSDRATARNLIDIAFKNKLIPNSMQSHFSGLRSTLETVGTLRNDHAHGQGSTVITVPDYMAAYALHLTASNILFLAKANEEME